MSDFETLEARLENWGRVVRLPRFQSGVCAAWARWYVSKRNSVEDDKYPVEVSIPKDEWDGWDVERAWASMPNHVAKWVLKYEYIWRMSPDQIEARMRKAHKVNLRGRCFDLVLADARSAISKVLIEQSAHKVIKIASKVLVNPVETAIIASDD